MKIVASKRDDILKERDEYRKDYDMNRKIRDVEHWQFSKAQHAVIDPIKEYLTSELAVYKALNFRIDVYDDFDRNIRVSIKCNEWTRTDDDCRWSYDARIEKNYKDDSYELVKSLGTWGETKNISAAYMKSLQQTVLAIEYLNTLDWDTILRTKLPEYKDYFKTREMPSREGEFARRLRDAELEEYIGTNTLVLVRNFESSGYYGRSVYVRILRETPSQYVVNVFSAYSKKEDFEGIDLDKRYTQRVKKTNIIPVEQNDVEGLVTIQL